jgi:hypothetical protein
MDFNIGQIQQALSVERLAGYALHGRAEPEEQLIRRYLWNVQLGEALYPVLHFTEIALRNRLHEALSRRAGREAWYEHFPLESREASAISDAKNLLQRRARPVTPGRLVAELHFGFWCSLFDV